MHKSLKNCSNSFKLSCPYLKVIRKGLFHPFPLRFLDAVRLLDTLKYVIFSSFSLRKQC